MRSTLYNAIYNAIRLHYSCYKCIRLQMKKEIGREKAHESFLHLGYREGGNVLTGDTVHDLLIEESMLKRLNVKVTCLAFCVVLWLFWYSYLRHLLVTGGLFLPADSLLVPQNKRCLSFMCLDCLSCVRGGSVFLPVAIMILGFWME